METIKVYGRVAPCSNSTNLVEIKGDRLVVSKLERRNCQNSATEFGFNFTDIFNQDATQGEVFDGVAKDVIAKFIDGYNGTIFAYGQTGTGKTYTIEGEDLNLDTSPRHGLIPQSLAMIYNEIDKIKNECIKVQISFLEMYNEMGYDLLGPLMYANSKTKDLPRILVTLGTSGSCTMHGLSLHDACTENDARRLHLKGRCNSTVGWSSGNKRSSRSHCIFTVLLTRQKQDSEIVVKSKLNIVDLAGSEKMLKSGNEEHRLHETKCIKLSLHHLETVIIALQRLHVKGTQNLLSKTLNREELKPQRCKSAVIPQDKTIGNSVSSLGWSGLKNSQSTLNVTEVKRRGFSLGSVSAYIPYRNSLLTMMLQDSLGGNCNTIMIATLSLDTNDLNETILTCRFAQRVARVTNNPVRNIEINETTSIKKLRSQVAKLMKDLADVQQNKSEQHNFHQEESEASVIEVVDGYMQGRIDDPTECGIDNPQKVRACFAYFKRLFVHRARLPDEPTSSDEKDSGVGMNCNTNEEPSSPSTADDSLRETSEESIRSPPPITKAEVVENQCKDAQIGTPSPSPTQTFFPQSMSSETVNCSSGIPLNDRKGEITGHRKLDEKQLILMELEVKKNDLIQKSKLLSTAVSNQKARVAAMEKRGCSIDGLANEKLAEQQLRRKQDDVERQISKTIKGIVDVKETNRVGTSVTHDKSEEQNSDTFRTQSQDTKDPHESQIDAQVYHRRKLELKERSTKLQLLTCRQKLDRVRIPIGSPEKVIPKETQSNQSESYPGEEIIIDASHFGSSYESKHFKPLDISPKNDKLPSDVIQRSRLPIARVQSSLERRERLTDNKRKIKNCALKRQSIGQSVSSPISARKPYMNTGKQSSASTSNSQTSPQSYGVLPSNVRTNHHLSSYTSNMFSDVNEGENKAYAKSVDRTRLTRLVNRNASQMIEGVSNEPACMKSRRPATCSPALIANRRATKRTITPDSSNINYKYDKNNNGFIVRTNDDVYRASNFQQPVPQSMNEHISNHNIRKESPPKYPLLSRNKHRLEHNHDNVTPILRDRVEPPALVLAEVSKEKAKPIVAYFKPQRTQINLGRYQNKEDLKGPQSENPKQPLNDDGPKSDLIVQRVISPNIISARKQQIERARRIRLVTNAAEIIQQAFRRYLRRRNNGIQLGNG